MYIHGDLYIQIMEVQKRNRGACRERSGYKLYKLHTNLKEYSYIRGALLLWWRMYRTQIYMLIVNIHANLILCKQVLLIFSFQNSRYWIHVDIECASHVTRDVTLPIGFLHRKKRFSSQKISQHHTTNKAAAAALFRVH